MIKINNEPAEVSGIYVKSISGKNTLCIVTNKGTVLVDNSHLKILYFALKRIDKELTPKEVPGVGRKDLENQLEIE